MIIYNKLWKLLESKGISKFKFRVSANIGGDTFERLRKNLPVSTTTLNIICITLDCTLDDIVEYISDEKEKESILNKDLKKQ